MELEPELGKIKWKSRGVSHQEVLSLQSTHLAFKKVGVAWCIQLIKNGLLAVPLANAPASSEVGEAFLSSCWQTPLQTEVSVCFWRAIDVTLSFRLLVPLPFLAPHHPLGSGDSSRPLLPLDPQAVFSLLCSEALGGTGVRARGGLRLLYHE